MKIINNVKSETMPEEIDDYSSSTTVFVRKNIHSELYTDPVFKTNKTIYTYDEIQYTFPEWNKIITDSIKEEGNMIQEQIDITQLALTEIMDLIIPVMQVNMLSTNNIDRLSTFKKYSGVALMYAGMIKRKLITIDRVQDVYRDEVLEILNNNMKE